LFAAESDTDKKLKISYQSWAVANYKPACDWLVASTQAIAMSAPMQTT
jgi:hypothetical protein